MLIIFGWLRRFTILGIKADECPQCGQVCEHVVGRKTNWGHVFWIPVLFLGWEHGMICTTCRAWTGIGWREVRAAMKSGVLRLDRPRPNAPALLAAAAAERGEPPMPPALVFDRLLVNPKRGAWDLYTKAWPVMAAGLLVFGGISSAMRPVSAGYGSGSGSSTSGSTVGAPVFATYPPESHQCWLATDGQLNGCTLSDGRIVGVATGDPVTCYFTDAELQRNESVTCDH